MKSLLTILLLLTSSNTWAAGLLKKSTPFLDQAVERIYIMGRHNADSGGIANIQTYENAGNLNTFFIVKEAMKEDPIANAACWDFGEEATNECVKLVLERSGDVMANYQVSNVYEWIGLLTSWEFGEQWLEDLSVVKETIKNYIGKDYKSFSYGVDGVADAWSTIMISKDKKKIMVISSDYGA